MIRSHKVRFIYEADDLKKALMGCQETSTMAAVPRVLCLRLIKSNDQITEWERKSQLREVHGC